MLHSKKWVAFAVGVCAIASILASSVSQQVATKDITTTSAVSQRGDPLSQASSTPASFKYDESRKVHSKDNVSTEDETQAAGHIQTGPTGPEISQATRNDPAPVGGSVELGRNGKYASDNTGNQDATEQSIRPRQSSISYSSQNVSFLRNVSKVQTEHIASLSAKTTIGQRSNVSSPSKRESENSPTVSDNRNSLKNHVKPSLSDSQMNSSDKFMNLLKKIRLTLERSKSSTEKSPAEKSKNSGAPVSKLAGNVPTISTEMKNHTGQNATTSSSQNTSNSALRLVEHTGKIQSATKTTRTKSSPPTNPEGLSRSNRFSDVNTENQTQVPGAMATDTSGPKNGTAGSEPQTSDAPTGAISSNTPAVKPKPASENQTDLKKKNIFDWLVSVICGSKTNATSAESSEPANNNSTKLPNSAQSVNQSSVSSARTAPQAAAQNGTIRSKNKNASQATTVPGNPNRRQALPGVGMSGGIRATSVAEKFSGALESVISSLRSNLALLSPFRDGPTIHYSTEDMIIARVSVKPRSEHLHKIPTNISVSRAVLYKGLLTVEIQEEFKSSKTDAAISHVSHEHVIKIGDAMADVNKISVRRHSQSSFDVVIPLDKFSEASQKMKAIMRLRAHEEEDEYDFLQAKLTCHRRYPGNGLDASLCACETIHNGNEVRRIACVARIIDRTLRVARRAGENPLAARLYRDAIGCRQRRVVGTKDRKVVARECLERTLKWSVKQSSGIQKRQARILLSTFDDTNAQQLEGDPEVELFMHEDEQLPHPSVRFIAAGVYLIGLLVLMWGIADIARHYQRHRMVSRRVDQFAQLPDHARALYSRLFA